MKKKRLAGLKGISNKIVAGCLILVITLILSETALRFLNFDFVRPLIGVGHRAVEIGPFVPHPSRFWCLTPSNRATEVNAQGFRGPVISREKPENVYRIFCLGNSCTFGVGCDYRQTFSARLQAMFDASVGRNRVEVVNAGVPGYSSLQEWRYLKEDIIHFEPDMVIVQYGENDEEGGNDRRHHPSPLFFHLFPVLSKAKLFQAGYALTFAIKKIYYDYNEGFREKISRRSYQNCLENIAEIEEFARGKGLDVFFITPVWSESGKLIRKDAFIKKPRIDIFPVLTGSGQSPSLLYFDPHHWLPAGHCLVAAAIYKTVHETVLFESVHLSRSPDPFPEPFLRNVNGAGFLSGPDG